MTQQSKRLKKIISKIDKKIYSLDEAISLVKTTANAKFDETIEAHIKLGIDPKKSDQTVRGVLSLPNGTGKKIRIAVFTESAEKEAGPNRGIVLVGPPASGKTNIVDLITQALEEYSKQKSTKLYSFYFKKAYDV